VRPYEPGDLDFLWEMLYEAAHPEGLEGGGPSREEALSDPVLRRYLEGWGRLGDTALVAVTAGGRRVGAALYRLFDAEEPGYGFLDSRIPDVGVVAVVRDFRGSGVGGALLDALKGAARGQGSGALSLAVSRDNLPAIRLYERHGFEKVSASGTSWVMRADLSADATRSDDGQVSGRTEET